jgi:hypothetical protein
MATKLGSFTVEEHITTNSEGKGAEQHQYELLQELSQTEKENKQKPMKLKITHDEPIENLILGNDVEISFSQPQKKLNDP